ncbi:AraC family transcriptional regulator [Herminiimonas sp. KBW02]|uniref:helix-turn-helix domain-containing protein n=1 Tax=Herminiimonas sp. KBW02 TaxID=2153363 RepID=UPI000F592EBB|nr:AraC family transcriptional regulator [Herminiimonas sp. KBW02]RQO33508.1 AraC family transcriptional regulator [Herminiimonas sp. KBW02]
MIEILTSEDQRSSFPLNASSPVGHHGLARTVGKPARFEFLQNEISIFPSLNDTRTVVRSSDGLGWENMFATLTQATPLAESIEPASYLFFAVPMQNLDLAIQIDGRTHKAEMAAHSQGIIAPGVRYELNLLQACDIFYLYIKNDVLTDVANEVFNKRLDEIDLYSPLEETDVSIQHLLNVCLHMLEETPDSSFRSDYIARAIVAQFYSRHTQLRDTPRVHDSTVPFSRAQTQRINDYMQAHLHETFQIADVAASIGMSRTIFFERFVHTIKKTPNQYLQILRVNRAKELLHHQQLSLADIASACGYADQSHFARFFKRFVGLTPGKYRIEISS